MVEDTPVIVAMVQEEVVITAAVVVDEEEDEVVKEDVVVDIVDMDIMLLVRMHHIHTKNALISLPMEIVQGIKIIHVRTIIRLFDCPK